MPSRVTRATHTMSVRLPTAIWQQVDDIARRTGLTATDVVRLLLTAQIENGGLSLDLSAPNQVQSEPIQVASTA